MVSRHHRNLSTRKFLSLKSNRAHPGSLERLQYLENLVEEYKKTDRSDYKEQIVANLGNFAYDPRNGPHLRQLNVDDIFFECLSEVSIVWLRAASEFGPHPSTDLTSIRLAELAIAGLSNLSASSPVFRQRLLDHPRFSCIIGCLASPSPSIVIHTLTILIHLFTRSPDREPSSSVFLSQFPVAVRTIRSYQQAAISDRNSNKSNLDSRIGILAQVLLEDCCS